MSWLRYIMSLLVMLIAVAGHSGELPATLTAALLVKVIEFEEGLNKSAHVSVLVVEDDSLFDALQRYRGDKFHFDKLNPQDSEQFPNKLEAQVVFLGSKQVSVETISRIQQQGKLVLSDHYELLKKGVHLVLFNDGGVPGIALRVASSQAGKVKWNPEILNYAVPVTE